MHATQEPSPWVMRWAHLVAPGGAVLDVACGAGRHMRFFASLAHPVTGVDRDRAAINAIQAAHAAPTTSAASIASAAHPNVNPCEAVCADIEAGPWPFAGRSFAGVVVINYLWRPLLPAIVGSVAPGGVLIYETFAAGNETVGKPARPDFLLQPGELLQVCGALRTVAYEDGFLEDPARFVQRIAAVRPVAAAAGVTAGTAGVTAAAAGDAAPTPEYPQRHPLGKIAVLRLNPT